MTYTLLAMLGSFFTDVPKGRMCFFRVPPAGYGLSCVGYLAHIVVIEWIGLLFVSPIFQPFVMGSPEHRAVIDQLPLRDYKDDIVELSTDHPFYSYQRTGGGHVAWSTSHVPVWFGSGLSSTAPSCRRFTKIISSSAYGKEYFLRAHRAYSALSTVRAAAGADVPETIVEAELLYGPAHIAVLMPFIAGREATDSELRMATGDIVRVVAAAIVWLARKGLLYDDLRGPNIRVGVDDRIYLLDYDDIYVVSTPPTTYDEHVIMLSDALRRASFDADDTIDIEAGLK